MKQREYTATECVRQRESLSSSRSVVTTGWTGGVARGRERAARRSRPRIQYNEQGPTSVTTTDGKKSGYLYAADGQLLIQRRPGSNTLYLSGRNEHLSRHCHQGRHQSALLLRPDGTVTVGSSKGGNSHRPTTPQAAPPNSRSTAARWPSHGASSTRTASGNRGHDVAKADLIAVDVEVVAAIGEERGGPN
ncbi:hypothetical protein [Streptomyces mirabilis]|uniref:hypothetical protein n=1 Tax=Streptomyces mirabilis TaxID=68239 RepID=UPI0036CD12B2